MALFSCKSLKRESDPRAYHDNLAMLFLLSLLDTLLYLSDSTRAVIG